MKSIKPVLRTMFASRDILLDEYNERKCSEMAAENAILYQEAKIAARKTRELKELLLNKSH